MLERQLFRTVGALLVELFRNRVQAVFSTHGAAPSSQKCQVVRHVERPAGDPSRRFRRREAGWRRRHNRIRFCFGAIATTTTQKQNGVLLGVTLFPGSPYPLSVGGSFPSGSHGGPNLPDCRVDNQRSDDDSEKQ
jgi:hypothetical protein